MGNKIKQAVQQQNQETVQRYQFTTIYNFELHTNRDEKGKTTKVTFNNYVFEIKKKKIMKILTYTKSEWGKKK